MKKYLLLFLFSFSCLAGCQSLWADDFYGYTEDSPLIVVCDWDLRPFEFMDSEGRPAGYNIDMLETIFKRLDIPHRFIMQEWSSANRMFEDRDADLIHGLAYTHRQRPYVMTQKYINYYPVKLVRRASTVSKTKLSEFADSDIIGVKTDDYAMVTLEARDSLGFQLRYRSPKDGLAEVSNGQIPYYIWGEEPLRHKLQELHLDSLVLDDIDLPVGELRIIGYDPSVIEAIDEQYARLEEEGEQARIYDKWFHPERVHDDTSPVAVYILGSLLAFVAVALLVMYVFSRRVRHAVARSGELHSMMTQALGMGDYYVLEYNFRTHRVCNVFGTMLPPGGLDNDEFIRCIAPDEREDFRLCVERMMRGELDEWSRRKHWNAGTEGKPVWKTFEGSAILERSEDGRPLSIIHTVKDITREVEEEAYNEALGQKYMKAFDTNLMAMSFYSADGHLIDLNQKMRELCGITEENEHLFRDSSLFDDPFVHSFFDVNSAQTYHVCGHLSYPDLGIDKYIESHIHPICNEEGRMVYYIIATRDVTAERDMYMKQREHDRQMQEANASLDTYERQLQYLLEESNMFVWRYNLDTRMITFARSLRRDDYERSIDEHLATMLPEDRVKATRIMEEKLTRHKPFSVVHAFTETPLVSRGTLPNWHSISGIPVSDANGEVHMYFGIVRDITELMLAQKKLREETARAEDSGRMKAAFLANMTHEIRTPLNAIVGFSELLPEIGNSDERKELIGIIRNNCDMLLRLINDILEASNMTQSLAIKPQAVDLSHVFDDICQTLQQRVTEPGVEFQKDNPYDTFPAVLDKGRLQQLLTNLVTNAVKYTHEGHICVGYREQERNMGGEMTRGIYFYCEDTGAGIPQEKQAAVFERFVKLNDFVQGTGLGLSICKAIVESCQGTIGVTSEGEGHGSTFWFWLPGEVKN